MRGDGDIVLIKKGGYLKAGRGGADAAGLLASDFDRTNDYGTLGGTGNGVSNGTKGIISVWFRVDGSAGATRSFFGTTNDLFFVRIRAFNTLRVICQGAGLKIDMRSSSTVAVGATYHHLAASWETGVLSEMFLDGSSDIATNTNNAGDIFYVDTDFAVGAEDPGQTLFDGALSEIYINTAETIGLAANIGKFRNPSTGLPVSLGPTGALVTGTAPQFYYPDGDPSNDQSGNGNNMTITGALESVAGPGA